MTPERWRQVKQILAEALEREPAERSTFLDRADALTDCLQVMAAWNPGIETDESGFTLQLRNGKASSGSIRVVEAK